MLVRHNILHMVERYHGKGAAALVLACVLSFLLTQPATTAENGPDVSLGVQQIIDGEIMHLQYPYAVDLYETMRINVTFKNTGSVQYQEKISMDIINWSLYVLSSFYDGYSLLEPGESRFFAVTYIPTVSGYQWIHVKVDFGGKEKEAWGSFYVRSGEEPIVPPTPPDYDDVTPGPAPPQGSDPVMRLNYTRNIEVDQGQSYLLYLEVENLGSKHGNISLDNIMFHAKSFGIPFSVVPEKIHKLERGQSGFFVVTLNVPNNIMPGEYVLDFTVISDRASRSGKIDINVKELPVKEGVWSTIQNYLFIIERLKVEIKDAKAEGVNTSFAEYYLNSSITAVDESIELYEKGDFENAKGKLTGARSYIERTVLELALARAELLRIVLPAYVSLLLVVLIIIAIMTAMFFVYARRRKKERETKQKQRA